MLTDYHLHLRPDELAATAAGYFTPANAERYREVAEDRGIAELGVAEHIHRFSQALDVWDHPLWREYAVDDIYGYCEFVRSQTDLRLGLEVDFVPGREDRTQNLIDRLELDYVVGSVHFVGDFAVDHGDYDIWTSGRSAREVWRRYFETLGAAAGSGLFDILAHPDLVKVWGAGRPRPDGDPRRFYELAMEGIADSGIAVEVSTAGLRKPVGELYPSPAFLEMCLDAGAPIALSSDAHVPGDVGRDYEAALELLGESGVGEVCVFERRTRRLESIG
ncbi:MAG: histidinol-phosphatase [Solirubrobacteraceae bacterium]